MKISLLSNLYTFYIIKDFNNKPFQNEPFFLFVFFFHLLKTKHKKRLIRVRESSFKRNNMSML